MPVVVCVWIYVKCHFHDLSHEPFHLQDIALQSFVVLHAPAFLARCESGFKVELNFTAVPVVPHFASGFYGLEIVCCVVFVAEVCESLETICKFLIEIHQFDLAA